MPDEVKGEILKSFGGSQTIESGFVKREEDGSISYNIMANLYNYDEKKFEKKKVRMDDPGLDRLAGIVQGMLDTRKELKATTS